MFKRLIHGKAHIGNLYHFFGRGFRLTCFIADSIRLSKQKYIYDDIKVTKDILYSKKKSKYHLLDIYTRKDHEDDKTIIVIHGGGLMYGKKELNRHSNSELCRRGFKVIAISYSLCPSSSFYLQLQEIQEVFQFIKDNKDKYKIDLSKLYLVGDSAGGMLAFTTMLIYSKDEYLNCFGFDRIIDFNSLGLISPMSTLEREDNSACVFRNAFKRKEKKLDCYKYLCKPLLMMNNDAKRMIISTSDNDFIRGDSLMLKESLEKYNVEHQFFDYESKKDKLPHIFPVVYPKYDDSQDFFDKLATFFK